MGQTPGLASSRLPCAAKDMSTFGPKNGAEALPRVFVTASSVSLPDAGRWTTVLRAGRKMNEAYMKRAAALSMTGMQLGHGGPFGAVVKVPARFL